MSKLKIYDMQGQEQGDTEIADDILAAGKGGQAVRDSVVGELAHRRGGTASSLRKGEVAGSGAKPWKQKGLGRARAGYRQSPVWRGGGVAFGPHPRKYGGKINRKVARLAFRRAFGDKLQAGDVTVIEALSVEKPRTRDIVAMLKALDVKGRALFLVDSFDVNAALSVRNIPKVTMAKASDVSVYELMRQGRIVITKAGLDVLKRRLNGGAE